MSILITGMEMPKSCGDCPVNMTVCKRGYEYLLAHPKLYNQRAEDCPISYVPPHGRLIDADAILKALNISGSMIDCAGCKHMGNYGCKSGAWAAVCEELTHAPTIIPASEEGE